MDNWFERSDYSGKPGVHILATFVSVCHGWREIVYNTPSLWAYISSDHPDRTNLECLARSDQAPLHIYFNFHDAICQEFRTKIFQEVHRWKSAELLYVPKEFLEELEQRQAPLLERLDVKGDGQDSETRNLFHGNASRLRHLTLLDIEIPWDSNLLSLLTALHIRTHYLSVQQVAQVLQSCPDLTSSKLFLPPDLRPGPIPLEAPIVELPRLEHLAMRVHPLVTEHLLRRMRIPSCKSFDVDHAEATSPTFTAAMSHLIPSLSSILLAATKVSIAIGSTGLGYKATAKINEDSNGDDEDDEDGMLVQLIHIQASGDRFTHGPAVETLSWLLDNVHTPSFSPPISLTILELDSSYPLILIMERLSSSITYLNLQLSSTSAKTIISYLAEPVKVVMDGTTTLRWPLPNLTDLNFKWCDFLEPEAVLRCAQRRAGRGLLSEGRREHREELPAKLTRLRLPRGSSIVELKRVFPDCMEWGGLELELAWEEYRNRSEEIITNTDQ
ncbi:hypothetical protein FRB94_009875 [Tulasnella sp. JGI-2019a]|nr:hypothetical protein FRB93_013738 [Tulasnella sp. JGI-2019a]KAG9010794.1 hypothetical protein FRB94_009875 [Tulasnella sp. JGI-2019a]